MAWNTVLNPVINVVLTSTNGHYSFFDNGSLTGGPALTKFYRILGSPNLGPIISPGPATNTVLAGGMSQAVVTVPANAIAASNFLVSATGPLNVWFNQTNPPTGDTNAGDFLMLSTATAGAFVLTSNSVPPLVPGTNYYLGFQNPGASNVTVYLSGGVRFRPDQRGVQFQHHRDQRRHLAQVERPDELSVSGAVDDQSRAAGGVEYDLEHRPDLHHRNLHLLR